MTQDHQGPDANASDDRQGPPVSDEGAEETGAPDESEVVPVVGVGASAGGLSAFRALLAHLGRDTGMAFVLIQHLDPRHESMLSELLEKGSYMPVSQAGDGTRIEPNHVYVIVPGHQLTLLHNRLHYLPEDQGSGRRNPVDTFFRSLADDRCNGAIGVILSGTASDGTAGACAIKEAGGVTFAQDRASAEYDGMPRSAVAAGCVDFVMGPADIARELIRLAKHPVLRLSSSRNKVDDLLSVTQDQLAKIFILLRARTGHDFSYYKVAAVKRRITRRMLVHKIDRLTHYLLLLQKDSGEVDALFQDLLINVTGFFRDQAAFDGLRDTALPDILGRQAADVPVRIWVPGCASGQEAYSIAILLHEFLGDRIQERQVQIFGSDIDRLAIERARAGIYPATIESEVSEVRLKRYFHKVAGGYQVSKIVRDMCVFALQDVGKDPPFSRLDLVSCRNLLIYFGAALQQKVLQVFHYALNPGGFLLLGSSESIGAQADLFALKDNQAKLYQKKSVAGRLSADLVFRPLQGSPVMALSSTDFSGGPVYDLDREVERVLLERYAPCGVVVDSENAVVRFLGRTWPYIEPSAGAASLNLFKVAHPDLVVELRAGIQAVRKGGGELRKENLYLRVDGYERRVTLQFVALRGAINSENHIIVVFEPRTVSAIPASAQSEGSTDEDGRLKAVLERNAELERELVSTRGYMQSIVEEQEGTNDELRAANEEIQSTNEELQSTNEELETAKEELQSVNEELATVNEEIENRNDELARINNDLTNLLASVNLPILMLSGDLRIRQFTQPAEKLLNLIDADLGRPIGNIKPNIEIPGLESAVLDVIQSMDSKTMELRDDRGSWYTLRIRPYKTADMRIDGAVLTFIDIDDIKDVERMQQALVEERRLAAVVRDSNDAVTVQGLDGIIQAWNPAAERMYGYTEEDAVGMDARQMVAQDDRAKWDGLLGDIRAGQRTRPLELGRIRKDHGTLKVVLVASALVDHQGRPVAVATTEREVDPG